MQTIAPSALGTVPRWLCWLSGTVLLCLAGLVAVWFGYQSSEKYTAEKFAVVDLAEIVRKHQNGALAAIVASSADDSSRSQALAEAQIFGKRLDAAVVQLSHECHCVLLVREAVVAGQLDDLTPVLRTHLGIK